MTNTTGTQSETNLRILLANEREEDLRALGDVLDGLGHDVTPFAVSVAEAVELIAREEPDLAFVVLDGNDEHGLALISQTVEYANGPFWSRSVKPRHRTPSPRPPIWGSRATWTRGSPTTSRPRSTSRSSGTATSSACSRRCPSSSPRSPGAR